MDLALAERCARLTLVKARARAYFAADSSLPKQPADPLCAVARSAPALRAALWHPQCPACWQKPAVRTQPRISVLSVYAVHLRRGARV